MFLSKPPDTEARSALYARDGADDRYVANLTRLWAWRPDAYDAFVQLRSLVTDQSALSMRDRAILVWELAVHAPAVVCIAVTYGRGVAVVAADLRLMITSCIFMV